MAVAQSVYFACGLRATEFVFVVNISARLYSHNPPNLFQDLAGIFLPKIVLTSLRIVLKRLFGPVVRVSGG
jgi:hypothetical protein